MLTILKKLQRFYILLFMPPENAKQMMAWMIFLPTAGFCLFNMMMNFLFIKMLPQEESIKITFIITVTVGTVIFWTIVGIRRYREALAKK